MDPAARAVGRLGDGEGWLGFVPLLAGGYALVVAGRDGRAHRSTADAADLVALAIAYFEESLGEPPEEIAATHEDIGAVVRHLVIEETDPERHRVLVEAVDAIDDGLAAEVVIHRLARIAESPETALARLIGRASELAGG